MRTRYLFGLPFITLDLNTEGIDFLLDTGFDGSLLLPRDIIKKHHLRQVAVACYSLADGHTAETEVFEARIDWLGKQKRVTVIAGEADFTLLGMALLRTAKTVIDPTRGELSISRP